MSGRRRASTRRAIACLGAALLGSSPSWAASVVLVPPSHPSAAMGEALVRVHGELISVGFDVELVTDASTELGQGESRGRLEQLAERRGADAVVAFVGGDSADSVEVWVIDKVTSKSVVRRVALPALSEKGPKLLAIRAIELLRASLLEIDLSSAPAPGESKRAPSPAVVRFVETERNTNHPERLAIDVGAAALLSPHGIGPAFLPLARCSWGIRPGFAVQASAAGLGTRPTVQTDAGRAELAEDFALLGVDYRLGSGDRSLPFVTLASGVLHSSAVGWAGLPYRGLEADLWSFLLDAGIGIRVPLRRGFHLSMAIHAQIAAPYPTLRFAGSVAASSGRPNVVLSFTLGAWL